MIEGVGDGDTVAAGDGLAVGTAATGGATMVGGAVGIGVGIGVGTGVGGRVGTGVGGGVGAGVAAPSTRTVPRMTVGWTAQKYPIVPALVNVTERLPVEKTPVSNDPLSAFAECGMPSWFVHVTDSPTFTGTLAGWNVTSRMVTNAFAACATPDASAKTSSTHAVSTPAGGLRGAAAPFIRSYDHAS